MAYTEVRGDTVEEYTTRLLAYAGERLMHTIKAHGAASEEFAQAVERWSEIIRLQVKLWPDTQDLAVLDSAAHQH